MYVILTLYPMQYDVLVTSLFCSLFLSLASGAKNKLNNNVVSYNYQKWKCMLKIVYIC